MKKTCRDLCLSKKMPYGLMSCDFEVGGIIDWLYILKFTESYFPHLITKSLVLAETSAQLQGITWPIIAWYWRGKWGYFERGIGHLVPVPLKKLLHFVDIKYYDSSFIWVVVVSRRSSRWSHKAEIFLAVRRPKKVAEILLPVDRKRNCFEFRELEIWVSMKMLR